MSTRSVEAFIIKKNIHNLQLKSLLTTTYSIYYMDSISVYIYAYHIRISNLVTTLCALFYGFHSFYICPPIIIIRGIGNNRTHLSICAHVAVFHRRILGDSSVSDRKDARVWQPATESVVTPLLSPGHPACAHSSIKGQLLKIWLFSVVMNLGSFIGKSGSLYTSYMNHRLLFFFCNLPLAWVLLLYISGPLETTNWGVPLKPPSPRSEASTNIQTGDEFPSNILSVIRYPNVLQYVSF